MAFSIGIVSPDNQAMHDPVREHVHSLSVHVIVNARAEQRVEVFVFHDERNLRATVLDQFYLVGYRYLLETRQFLSERYGVAYEDIHISRPALVQPPRGILVLRVFKYRVSGYRAI